MTKAICADCGVPATVMSNYVLTNDFGVEMLIGCSVTVVGGGRRGEGDYDESNMC
jgi:hypothetical protein